MRRIIDRPSPITGGKLELCSELATVEYRGETISYERSFYHCIDSDMEFEDEEVEAKNLKLIYDTYRLRHSIPLAEDLKLMRERYGLPLSAVSTILGLGENQYALYEDGAVPTASIGRLLAFVMDPAYMLKLLQFTRGHFTDKQYRKYYKSIVASMPPAQYDIEEKGIMDYGLFGAFPPASVSISNNVPSPRRKSYNDYVYAAAC